MSFIRFGILGCFLCALVLLGCGQSGEVKREEFTGQAKADMYQSAENLLLFLPADFDYDSMLLFKDEESNVVGLANKGDRGFIAGNSVNRARLTTCSVYEVISIKGGDITFPNLKCGASASLDGPELTLRGMDGCDVCGLGASIEGTYTRFAEIIFDLSGEQVAVKHVYRIDHTYK